MGKLYSWNDITKIYLEGSKVDSVYIEENNKLKHYIVTPEGLKETHTEFFHIRDVYEELCKSPHVASYSINQDEINKKLMMMELIT